MSKITLLPPEIFQKIAAGEIIERPFSVVKELVENSLDAKASGIKIDLLEGGKNLIRVTDDGHGMSHEDALVCFKRHSTSKILEEGDLNQISTLGFRGEALPSISAVSRVILKTSESKEERGTLIEREGEEEQRVADCAFPKGTGVEVKDLFFNLPARRKFLRSEKHELSQIVKYLTNLALANWGVRFSLNHGDRAIFNYPPVSSLKERIYQIYGKSLLERLMEIDYEEEGRRLFGYVSRPPSGRRDKKQQFFFINRRTVRDKILLTALNRAFQGFLEKEHFVEAFLFLDLPFSEVDVNVHPAKSEVRFEDSRPIFRLVHISIEQAVLKELGVKEVYPKKEGHAGLEIEEDARPFLFKQTQNSRLEIQDLFVPTEETKKIYPRVLGQYLDTYIVVAKEEGILIVDQHNAHERVLFEKYEELDLSKNWPRKLALLPILFDLSPSQVLSLENTQDLLEEAGFRVEAMGGQSFALKEYPDIFKEEEAKDVFFSLLEEIKEEKIEERKKKILFTLACKTAIKAGESLTHEKMIYLVEELFKTSNAALCPHGRPITVRLKRSEIEKGLRRS